MTVDELQNWIAVYAATAACCAFALVLSSATVMIEVCKERSWREINTVKSALIFAPKLWWRWQKRYLMSTPITLAIVSWFALTLDWTH